MDLLGVSWGEIAMIDLDTNNKVWSINNEELSRYDRLTRMG